MQSISRQQGMTFISFIFLMALIGFFTLLILKIGPIYLHHSKVVNAFSAVENTPDLEIQSVGQIRNMFAKRFNINYVDKVNANEIKITKKGDFYVKVLLDYEVVEPIFGNLSVLVEFHEEFEKGKL